MPSRHTLFPYTEYPEIVYERFQNKRSLSFRRIRSMQAASSRLFPNLRPHRAVAVKCKKGTEFFPYKITACDENFLLHTAEFHPVSGFPIPVFPIKCFAPFSEREIRRAVTTRLDGNDDLFIGISALYFPQNGTAVPFPPKAPAHRKKHNKHDFPAARQINKSA